MMHYYRFHIGDYRSATAHLSNEEDLAYRRLLDMYYDTELPIPLETQWVARRLRVASQVLATVLQDFFEETENGWIHSKCDRYIAEYQAQAERNRINGRKGGRRKILDKKPSGLPVGTQSKANAKATNNQEPITNNQEEKEKVPKRKFVPPTLEEVRAYCQERGNRVDPERFIDHYQSNGWMVGKTKMKDWKAAVRNWEKRDETNRAVGGRTESAFDRRKRVRDQLRAEAMRWVDPDQMG